MKVEVPFMLAVPGREARLRGWDWWEAHMLAMNARHVLGIKRGAFIVLTPEDVWAMSRERVEALMARALAQEPSRSSRWSRLRDCVMGTWRYVSRRDYRG